MRWAYEVPHGPIHVIDDDELENLDLPVKTVQCVKSMSHKWDKIPTGIRCRTCGTVITQLD